MARIIKSKKSDELAKLMMNGVCVEFVPVAEIVPETVLADTPSIVCEVQYQGDNAGTAAKWASEYLQSQDKFY